MFPDLKKWPFVGVVLCMPAVQFPLVTRAICSRGAPYVGCMGPSVFVDAYCGQYHRSCWSPVQLVARPCLVQRLLAAGWLGSVIRRLM